VTYLLIVHQSCWNLVLLWRTHNTQTVSHRYQLCFWLLWSKKICGGDDRYDIQSSLCDIQQPWRASQAKLLALVSKGANASWFSAGTVCDDTGSPQYVRKAQDTGGYRGVGYCTIPALPRSFDSLLDKCLLPVALSRVFSWVRTVDWYSYTLIVRELECRRDSLVKYISELQPVCVDF